MIGAGCFPSLRAKSVGICRGCTGRTARPRLYREDPGGCLPQGDRPEGEHLAVAAIFRRDPALQLAALFRMIDKPAEPTTIPGVLSVVFLGAAGALSLTSLGFLGLAALGSVSMTIFPVATIYAHYLSIRTDKDPPHDIEGIASPAAPAGNAGPDPGGQARQPTVSSAGNSTGNGANQLAPARQVPTKSATSTKSGGSTEANNAWARRAPPMQSYIRMPTHDGWPEEMGPRPGRK